MGINKILVVDDEDALISVVREYLEPRGYDVISANNGKTALEKVREKPDLILLDITMPGMDGFETLRRLKSDPKTGHVPIIMLTAKRESSSIFKTQELGATDYIIKPFRLEELLSIIKKYTP